MKSIAFMASSSLHVEVDDRDVSDVNEATLNLAKEGCIYPPVYQHSPWQIGIGSDEFPLKIDCFQDLR